MTTWPAVDDAIVRESSGIGSISVHHVEVGLAVAVAQESDSLSVGRPRWRPFRARAVRDVDYRTDRRIHHQDVGAPREGNVRGVRRPGGRSERLVFFL